MARRAFSVGLFLALSANTASAESGSARAPHAVEIPIVGCASDGQLGPQNAPQARRQTVRLDARIAERLALYTASTGPQVLGPRGWHCFGLYGSNGSVLFVAPAEFGMDSSLQPTQAGVVGFAGLALQVTFRYGDTSGRNDVIRLIARLFPSRRPSLIKAGWSESDLPSGPYPNDRLIRRNPRIVEFETPPHSNGLGTDSYLLSGDAPIRGVAVLQGTGDMPDSAVLVMRLPKEMHDLAPIILREFER